MQVTEKRNCVYTTIRDFLQMAKHKNNENMYNLQCKTF